MGAQVAGVARKCAGIARSGEKLWTRQFDPEQSSVSGIEPCLRLADYCLEQFQSSRIVRRKRELLKDNKKSIKRNRTDWPS